MSIVMSAFEYDDRYEVSRQETLRRELAYNASEIHKNEAHLEGIARLPQATKGDLDYVKTLIKILYAEREKLSAAYLKEVHGKK